MSGWDYKTVVLHGGFLGRHKEELNRAAFEKHLDDLGRDGFELCWVLLEQRLHGEKDGHVMIFKRPSPAPAERFGAQGEPGEVAVLLGQVGETP